MWLVRRWFVLALSYVCAISVSDTDVDKKFKNSCERLEESISANLELQTELLQHILEIKQKAKTLHNVAVGRVQVWQSSKYMYNLYTQNPATNAIDGSLNSFSETDVMKMPYWWIDLDNIYKIESVEIFNIGTYLHNMDVTVGLTLDNMTFCAHFIGPAFTPEYLILKCKTKLTGRFVKLSINTDSGILKLGEVKVYAYE